MPIYNPGGSGGGGTGTVTEIDTGAGLTGGPITNAGTISMAPVAAHSLIGNPGTASAPPSTAIAIGANLTLSAGGTLSASSPGTGTVTSIVAGTGLSGGTITTSGTLAVTAATTAALGGVIVGSGLHVSGGGTISLSGLSISIGTVAFGAGGVASNGTVDLTFSAANAAHITSAVFNNGSGGGTIVAAVQIGTTAVTGMSAVTIAAGGTVAASGANAISAGNAVRVVFSGSTGTISDGGGITVLGTLD